MYQAIIFDFDGVIINSEPLHFQAFKVITDMLGIDMDRQTYLQEYMGFSDQVVFKKLLEIHNLDATKYPVEWLTQQKGKQYAALVSSLDPCPGVVQLVEAANKKNLPLAICSGATRIDIDTVLSTSSVKKIAHHFQLIVSANDVVNSKPDPSCYLLAAEKLNIDPKNCIAIEDSPVGLTAAKGANMYTIGVKTTYPAEQLKMADIIVNTLEEIDLELL